MRNIKKLHPASVRFGLLAAVTMKVAALHNVSLCFFGTSRSIPMFRINLLCILVVEDSSTFRSCHIPEE